MRAAAVAVAVVLLAACGGEGGHGRELVPGSRATIGIVTGEPMVARGVRVEANRINNAGGIGGALTIDLVRGSARMLADEGVQLAVLPCRAGLVPAARRLSRAGAIAVMPCDDGLLAASLRNVYPTSLSPEAQADALRHHVDGQPARVLPARTPRGGRVAALLDLRAGGSVVVSPDTPERELPADDMPDGTLFATYGFPDPGSRVDEFAERFKATFDARPTTILAALGADALNVLAYAVELAQSTRPEHVAESFAEGFEVRGVLGEISFPEGRLRPEVDAAIVRLRDGRLRTVATVRPGD